MNLIKYNEKKQRIDTLLDGVQTLTEPEEIIKHIHGFYSTLYSKDNVDENVMDEYLNTIQGPEISTEDNININKPITLPELTNTMKGCKGTTPGPDGINILVYRAIWDIAGPIILKAWEYSLEIGELAPSQKESAICLLDKKGKDRRIISNLRPITLSNCDLKIITKIYTKRLDPILNTIINPNQSAYLSGRQVHDGLRTIDLLKEHCRTQMKDGYLISLDAKKAYDSVSHEYIKKVLGKLGFEPQFGNIFSILYRNISTRVVVNGIQTEPIKINRGVKQGDALSCSLFILIMETLNRKIESNQLIPCIKYKNIQACKVIAYADDVAILTQNKEGIVQALQTYQSFSHASGLYINPEKTEILNLRRDCTHESIETYIYGMPVRINLTNQITICGKTFANNAEVETQNNIISKIKKLENSINSWNKRNLTIEGRILVLKTFGISQTLYTMQNTTYGEEHLKNIEKIIFKFIWKGKDRIKRSIMVKDYHLGGLKAPNIHKIDQCCKLKQVIRSARSNHPIRNIQEYQPDLSQVSNNYNGKNQFVKTANQALNDIGVNLMKEIVEAQPNEILTLHRDHETNIAQSNFQTIKKLCKLNPIQALFVKAEMTKLNAITLNEAYRINQTDNTKLKLLAEKLPNNFAILLQKFEDRNRNEAPEETENRLSKIPVRLNIFRKIKDIKSSDLNMLESIENPENNPFNTYRNIRHPRERTMQFLMLHNRFYNNTRLAKHKIIESPKCHHCEAEETNDHLINECIRSTEIWNYVEQRCGRTITLQEKIYGSNDRWLNNIISLTKLILSTNRQERVNLDLARTRINNRIKDTVFINLNNTNLRILRTFKKNVHT